MLILTARGSSSAEGASHMRPEPTICPPPTGSACNDKWAQTAFHVNTEALQQACVWKVDLGFCLCVVSHMQANLTFAHDSNVCSLVLHTGTGSGLNGATLFAQPTRLIT